jgi:nicotinamidase-related amidase
MSKALFIIDPQKDFIDDPAFPGSLAVTGAYEDMKRLAQYIEVETPEAIVVTMDTHNRMHIANPMWWVDENGENPGIFTLISVADVESGKWKASVPEKQEHSLNYVKELAAAGKYVLCIWPYHCIDGTEGHKVTEVIKESLTAWESKTGNKVEYVFKGKNPNTEMYSGLKAEVVMSEDPETEINESLIEKLKSFDEVEVAGEAKSHCVASTVGDLIGGFGKEATKITILENCMSSVTGFEANGDNFITIAKEAGCTIKNVAVIAKKLKM